MVEDLQAVVEHVPLGVIFEVLLDVFQRQEQALINLKPIDLLCRVGDSRFQIHIGILAGQVASAAR